MANTSKIVVWIILVAMVASIYVPDPALADNNNNHNHQHHNNNIDTCPSVTEAVYPYWSLCYNPATYVTPYWIESQVEGTEFGYLAPEWDETNSTYYVRLVNSSESAASYSFTYITREFRPYIAVGDKEIVGVNTESGRSLAWRDEGGQSFLIESESDAAFFSFSADTSSSVALPCPLIYPARCGIYNLVSSSNFSLGVAPYEEDGAVYFQLSSSDFAPFLLRVPQLASSAIIRQPIRV